MSFEVATNNRDRLLDEAFSICEQEFDVSAYKTGKCVEWSLDPQGLYNPGIGIVLRLHVLKPRKLERTDVRSAKISLLNLNGDRDEVTVTAAADAALFENSDATTFLDGLRSYDLHPHELCRAVLAKRMAAAAEPGHDS